MFSKICSIVFTTLQLKFKATGRTTTEVWIVHGGESTYPVVPLKFCRALLWKMTGRNAKSSELPRCRNSPALHYLPVYNYQRYIGSMREIVWYWGGILFKYACERLQAFASVRLMLRTWRIVCEVCRAHTNWKAWKPIHIKLLRYVRGVDTPWHV